MNTIVITYINKLQILKNNYTQMLFVGSKSDLRRNFNLKHKKNKFISLRCNLEPRQENITRI